MKKAFFLTLAFIASLASIAPATQASSKNDAKILAVAIDEASVMPLPSVPFSHYDKIEVQPLTYGPSVSTDKHKVKRVPDVELRFRLRVMKTVDQWNARKTTAEHTLIVKPRIAELHIVSGGARFFAGAFAGSSSLSINLEFVDGQTGEVIASQTVGKSSDAMAGAWSFGSTDKNLMNYVAEIANQYIVRGLNMPEPTVAAPATPVTPAAAGGGSR